MKLKVTIDVPIYERLDIDGDRVVSKVAQWGATRIRQRLRRGVDADGQAIPRPVKGGKPLRRTGDLIRSIKSRRARKGRTSIAARGNRADGKPNELLMAAQQKLRGQQIMGFTAEDEALASEIAHVEIARQLARAKSGGIIRKLKRLR